MDFGLDGIRLEDAEKKCFHREQLQQNKKRGVSYGILYNDCSISSSFCNGRFTVFSVYTLSSIVSVSLFLKHVHVVSLLLFYIFFVVLCVSGCLFCILLFSGTAIPN